MKAVDDKWAWLPEPAQRMGDLRLLVATADDPVDLAVVRAAIATHDTRYPRDVEAKAA